MGACTRNIKTSTNVRTQVHTSLRNHNYTSKIGAHASTTREKLTEMPTGSIKKPLTTILARYERYEKYLKYPGEWGERTFRAWLVFEAFHDYLKWPIQNIIFGEIFDTLFVNDAVRPVIYLETKKPKRGLADMEAFRRHIEKYETLEWAILTDGYEWLKVNCVKNNEQSFSLSSSKSSEMEGLFRLFKASNYLYSVKNAKD